MLTQLMTGKSLFTIEYLDRNGVIQIAYVESHTSTGAIKQLIEQLRRNGGPVMLKTFRIKNYRKA